MKEQSMKLPIDRTREAMAAITAAHQEPDAAVVCPVCGVPGLSIEDRSVRPHAQWYLITCASCGLDDTIHIPMGPPPGTFG